jgi:hypothetical protein
MGFGLRGRPRVDDSNVILAAVGMRKQQDPLCAGRADGDKRPLVQGMIRIVKRQCERIREHAGRLVK